MNHDHKENNPYQGYFGASLFLFLMPIPIAMLFNELFNIFQARFGTQISLWSAVAIAGFISLCFTLGILIKGNYFSNMMIVIRRVKDFVAYSFTNFKAAWEVYRYQVTESGLVFWIQTAYLVYDGMWLYLGISKFVALIAL